MLTLLIARHGNTFDPGDTILRVGKQTDLPLSNSGREQAKKLSIFLNEKYPKIDNVFVSSLKRTQETALIALPNISFEIKSIFDEIDYGIDDGKPESEVIERVGVEALKQWEERGIPPSGWLVNPEKIIKDWQDFTKNLVASVGATGGRPGTILVVTSNGIARFAPTMTNDFETFKQSHSIKMRTGSISALKYIDGVWRVEYWDARP